MCTPKKYAATTLVPFFGMSRIKDKNVRPEMLVRKFFACTWLPVEATRRKLTPLHQAHD